VPEAAGVVGVVLPNNEVVGAGAGVEAPKPKADLVAGVDPALTVLLPNRLVELVGVEGAVEPNEKPVEVLLALAVVALEAPNVVFLPQVTPAAIVAEI